MTNDTPKKGPEAMCVNERNAVESVASIMRHLVANGLIAAADASRTMAGSTQSLSDPRERAMWDVAAARLAVPLRRH